MEKREIGKRKNKGVGVRGVCVLDRGREPRSECARRRGDVDTAGGASVGRVGVDEERCVHDTEHRRTGDCFEHDWYGKERNRRERSRLRGNRTESVER